jgi:hypothetical protein
MRRNLFWLNDDQWRQIEPYLPTDVGGKDKRQQRKFTATRSSPEISKRPMLSSSGLPQVGQGALTLPAKGLGGTGSLPVPSFFTAAERSSFVSGVPCQRQRQ